MNSAVTVGLALAKNVFQPHGVDPVGTIVLRRKLRRGEAEEFFRSLPPVMIGMEACGGAHYRARVLRALGHQDRLMPPAYVKPYVKRGKTDAADAEAICEAVTRPTMRFRYARRSPHAADWPTRLLARRPFKVAAVAPANKMARIAWALLTKGGSYGTPAAT